MTIEVFGAYNHICGINERDKITVVIDALRSCSTITTALYNGCKQVIPVSSIEQARRVRDGYSKDEVIMGGEIDSKIISGFDLGNSPQQYTRDVVLNKSVILKTNKGTKTISRVKNLNVVLIGCMLNISAVAKEIENLDRDVIILNSGRLKKLSIEDLFTSGAIISRIGKKLKLDDLGVIALTFYNEFKDVANRIFKESSYGKELISLGLEADIDYCLQQDVCGIVPFYRDGAII